MKVIKHKPKKLGVYFTKEGIYFCVIMKDKDCCGITLYAGDLEVDISFHDELRNGCFYCGIITKMEYEFDSYLFYENGKSFLDPYARAITGTNNYDKKDESHKRNVIFSIPKDWEKGKNISIPYEKSIFYNVHVRGFTKHPSSKVKAPGSFQGITEKIAYLKKIGITSITLMPCYEFDELDTDPYGNLKLNYWGYKTGYYFMPKASYAITDDPQGEFYEMVNSLHDQGIEVIMQLYFDHTMPLYQIVEILKFWYDAYHVDGFWMIGKESLVPFLMEDPYLASCKILTSYVDDDKVVFDDSKKVARCNDDFMINMRKFLKGDEDTILSFLELSKKNPNKLAQMNYLTSYNGFTLYDLVSYDVKHNEVNGENNLDGMNYNYSWNCGQEGKTRKRSVNELRKKQIKNALLLLLLSQGTPMIQSGDEFCRTQLGNNNPYCQDNEISWIDWNLAKKNEDILQFFKEIVALRLAHPVFASKQEKKVMDTLRCGYPDLSYHGKDAWCPELYPSTRHVGLMYCGKYEKNIDGKEDSSFYLAYNLHWEKQKFALPKLPKKFKWVYRIITDQEMQSKYNKIELQNEIELTPRTIVVLMGVETE